MLVVKVFEDGDIKVINAGQGSPTNFGGGAYNTHEVFLRSAVRGRYLWRLELGSAQHTIFTFYISDIVFKNVIASAKVQDD